VSPEDIAGDVIICRCERVTLGDLEQARRDFAVTSGRELKLSTRASMGICQGRVCRSALEALYREWFPPDRDLSLPRAPARAVPFSVLGESSS
jgi:hypothetical protein